MSAQNTEPGFIVKSPCGREWFVPLEAVGRDYADFLEQADKLSSEEAARISGENRDFWPTWFAQQCYYWSDIERLGRITKKTGVFKTKRAMDKVRGRCVEDYVAVGISK